MFCLSSTYEKVRREADELRTQLEQANQKIAQLEHDISVLTSKAETVSVRFDFDSDFQKATPVITFNDESVEKLLEIRRITPGATDQFSVQLALLTLAEEVAGQIVDLYTDPQD
jgi:phage shock protein A